MSVTPHERLNRAFPAPPPAQTAVARGMREKIPIKTAYVCCRYVPLRSQQHAGVVQPVVLEERSKSQLDSQKEAKKNKGTRHGGEPISETTNKETKKQTYIGVRAFIRRRRQQQPTHNKPNTSSLARQHRHLSVGPARLMSGDLASLRVYVRLAGGHRKRLRPRLIRCNTLRAFFYLSAMPA